MISKKLAKQVLDICVSTGGDFAEIFAENTYSQVFRMANGKVLEASKLEGSDKLLVLKVKIEDCVRQIVSGISNHYTPESLVGKCVVVVANLKPAKIRGVESYGMILACENKKGLEVLEVRSMDEYSKVR